MDKHEIDGYLGQVGQRVAVPMTSRAWDCSICGHAHRFDVPQRAPAPCVCGSIAFNKVASTQH